jgi:hypothetical protein
MSRVLPPSPRLWWQACSAGAPVTGAAEEATSLVGLLVVRISKMLRCSLLGASACTRSRRWPLPTGSGGGRFAAAGTRWRSRSRRRGPAHGRPLRTPWSSRRHLVGAQAGPGVEREQQHRTSSHITLCKVSNISKWTFRLQSSRRFQTGKGKKLKYSS